MTKWPLICETCEREVYIGSLYGGECKECHHKTTLDQLSADSGGQSALGDFA